MAHHNVLSACAGVLFYNLGLRHRLLFIYLRLHFQPRKRALARLPTKCWGIDAVQVALFCGSGGVFVCHYRNWHHRRWPYSSNPLVDIRCRFYLRRLAATAKFAHSVVEMIVNLISVDLFHVVHNFFIYVDVIGTEIWRLMELTEEIQIGIFLLLRRWEQPPW